MAGPNFAITADAGSMTVMFSHLFSKGGFWDAGAGVPQPVFDGERLNESLPGGPQTPSLRTTIYANARFKFSIASSISAVFL